jgi:prolipoprotein diacylglyceryltransferase
MCCDGLIFPVTIELFGARLHPHLLFEALAYALGFNLYLALRPRFPRARVSGEQTVWILAGCILGALAGSKLLAFLENREAFLSGKTIVGGLLGGWIGVELAKKKMRIESSTGDATVFPLLLGMAVGRIGCFLTGLADHTYGVATTLPWGVDFGDGIARHPTQLYDIVFLAALALVFARTRALPNGMLFRVFCASYLGYRFLIEFLKPREVYLGLSAIQIACLAGLLASARGIVVIKARPAHA